MSNKAINWAWSLDLPHSEKVVLVFLADKADDQGVCWPAQATIARSLSYKVRIVRYSLAGLARRGLLLRFRRRRENGSRRSDAYLLVGWPGRAPFGPNGHKALYLGVECVDDPNMRQNMPDVAPPSSGDRPSGKICTTKRQNMPGLPAKYAALEPSIEPSREPFPPTPTAGTAESVKETRHEQEGRQAQRAHGRSIADIQRQGWDRAVARLDPRAAGGTGASD